MADGRHFENCKMRYISNSLTNFLAKFGMAMHIRPPNMTVKPKISKFKMAGGVDLENQQIAISTKPSGQFCCKFCTITYISSPEFIGCSKKIKFLKNPR